MSQPARIFHNGPVFDGERLHKDRFARIENGLLAKLGPVSDMPGDAARIDLNGDILSVGYVDLQVNGGGGVMFNDDPSVETLRSIASAHRDLAVTRLLATLITDTPGKTRAAINAVIEAAATSVPGIAGLHLEGPHLSVARKGAHDATLIRRMEDGDMRLLLAACAKLPCLKVTVAPENVTEEQVAQLTRAGILVSLGHSDASFETCQRYFAAGARCVTHLFNAMSQMGGRAPGLVGAALANGAVSAGLIADAVHVHPEVMRAAWRAKRRPGRIFLVSDAMAVAGTDFTAFRLEGREIKRGNGKLTLADGTLAGADLDLTTAISVLVNKAGVELEEALAAAISVPASLCDMPGHRIIEGRTPARDLIRISADLKHAKPLIDQSVDAGKGRDPRQVRAHHHHHISSA